MSYAADVKAVRRALKREAFFCCPNCDGQTCLRCFEAQEAVERIMAHLWAIRGEGIPLR